MNEETKIMDSLKVGQTIKLKRNGKGGKITIKKISCVIPISRSQTYIEFEGIKGDFLISPSVGGSYLIFDRYPRAVAHPLRRLMYHEVI